MKYQLAIFWKDDSATGRVIDLAWPLVHDLKDVERVAIAPYGDVIPMPSLEPAAENTPPAAPHEH